MNGLTVIRTKTGYHSKHAIRAMTDQRAGKYVYYEGKSEKAKTMSFDYVEWKALKLSAWAAEAGLSAGYWQDWMRGRIDGFKLLWALIDAVEWHCKLTGKECHVMLCPELIDYEGFNVIIGLKSKSVIGRLERLGEGIKTHHIFKPNGAMLFIRPDRLKSVELL